MHYFCIVSKRVNTRWRCYLTRFEASERRWPANVVNVAFYSLGVVRADADEKYDRVDANAQPSEHSQLFIELCEVVDGIPPDKAIPIPVENSLTHETDVDVYWRECCRWLQFRQRYDHAVSEFEAPTAIGTPFSSVTKVRSAIEKCECFVLDWRIPFKDT